MMNEPMNDIEVQEYYEGRITGSDWEFVEVENTAKFNFEQAVNSSDRKEVVKFVHNSKSRQREEAGARETPAEISPDRP